ncbi:MAG: glutamate--tRNA ligase [Clostridiales bacterium]|nr:glutamate--tRNA ligase [Clostridiales bacterium]
MKQIRTRFAPSPTGYMHLGNLRTALYTWLYARNQKGIFILRVEDTDQKREVEGAVDIIYSSMKLAGLDWEEGPDVGGDYGPYIQSKRQDSYLPYAKELVESGHAYYCFCMKERLDGMREEMTAKGETFKYDKHCLSLSKEQVQERLDAGEEYVIRQNVPLEGSASFDDAIFGRIEVQNSDLDDAVLIKSDLMPTYNFANVVDDHSMDITHVMRGSEYLSSTPRYNLLYDAFGWEKPVYIHLSPVMANAQRKLSKRQGDPSFEDLLEQGFLIEAVINYIALLGWSPGTEQEMFTLEELKGAFSLEGLSKSPAIFDMQKLTWMNAEYIKKLNVKEFHDLILPYMKKVIDVDKFDTMYLAELLKQRCEVLPDIMEKIDFLEEMPEYSTDLYFHKRMKTNAETAKPVLQDMVNVLDALDTWTVEGIRSAVMGYIEKTEVKNGYVLWPLRVAISGKMSTPGGAYEITYLIGKEETIARLKKSISML